MPKTYKVASSDEVSLELHNLKLRCSNLEELLMRLVRRNIVIERALSSFMAATSELNPNGKSVYAGVQE